jgi:hypothetical protein
MKKPTAPSWTMYMHEQRSVDEAQCNRLARRATHHAGPEEDGVKQRRSEPRLGGGDALGRLRQGAQQVLLRQRHERPAVERNYTT